MREKIKVFDTKYTVRDIADKGFQIKMIDKLGYTELYSKEIVLDNLSNHPMAVNNIIELKKKVLRHELFHAVFHECGLTNYCDDEVLVEFLAGQFPKIAKIMAEADSIIEKDSEND